MTKTRSSPGTAEKKRLDGSAGKAGPSIRKDPADTQRASKAGKGLKAVAGKRDKDEV